MLAIVDLDESSIEGFHAAFDAVAREGSFLARTEAPPIDAFKAGVLENLGKGIPQLVALDDARVVGWCQIFPHARPTEAHCGSLGMGLIKTHRGRGLGAGLLAECLRKAEDFGLERIELEVFSENENAIRLYSKAGFLREGEKIDAVKIDGDYIALVLMAKLLDRRRRPFATP